MEWVPSTPLWQQSASCWHSTILSLSKHDSFTPMERTYLNTPHHSFMCLLVCCHFYCDGWGWVGLWGFLWWAPSAKRKDHHGVSSGWSSVWHRSNTGLSSTQYEQIPIIFGVWPFCLTPFFFRSITFGGLMVKLYFLCWNYSLSSGWHIIAA